MQIRKDMTVGEAMRQIVADYYAAVPYEDFTKQVFVQIGNAAEQSKEFVEQFENVVSNAFTALPDLETLKDFVLDAIAENRTLSLRERWMREIIKDNGILDLAKKFAN